MDKGQHLRLVIIGGTTQSPTTNFGRWMSDQRRATILLQYREVEEEDPLTCEENILQRVVWAESDDDAEMVSAARGMIRNELEKKDRED